MIAVWDIDSTSKEIVWIPMIGLFNYFLIGPALDFGFFRRSRRLRRLWRHNNSFKGPKILTSGPVPSRRQIVPPPYLGRGTHKIVSKLEISCRLYDYIKPKMQRRTSEKIIYSYNVGKKSLILTHFFEFPVQGMGGYDLTSGWDGPDDKILGPFENFLSCCYAVAGGASAACAGMNYWKRRIHPKISATEKQLTKMELHHFGYRYTALFESLRYLTGK